ncbi:MAG: homoserine kinase [Vicinamibacterales bacterium]
MTVHGSTSNLGPGFDAFGLAVDRRLELDLTEVDDAGDGGLTCEFVDGEPGGRNLIDVGYRAFAEATGARLPAARVEVRCTIPPRAGLGSSGAAIVAGLRLASRLRPDVRADLLSLGVRVEGHPDNVSAALRGGFVLNARRADDTFCSRTLPWPDGFGLVLALPEVELDTRVSRSVLPASLPLADAVFNLQHASLLVYAIGHADADALREALRDRLHQPARERIVPGLSAMLALRHPNLIGAFLSGAGPAVIAVCDGATTEVEGVIRSTYADAGVRARVEAIRVVQPGAVENDG